MQVLKFTIPNWAVCPVINADNSSLEEEDIKKLDEFIETTVYTYGNANFALPDDARLDLGFKHTNDIDNLGSDCTLLLLLVPNVD